MTLVDSVIPGTRFQSNTRSISEIQSLYLIVQSQFHALRMRSQSYSTLTDSNPTKHEWELGILVLTTNKPLLLLFSILFFPFCTTSEDEILPITDYVQERQFFLRMRSVMSRRGSGGKGKVIGYRVSVIPELKTVASCSKPQFFYYFKPRGHLNQNKSSINRRIQMHWCNLASS